MTDIIRSQVEENEEKIIKYQVMDNKNDDKIIRHQVMGIGGGSETVLESLTVTENGTYTPGEGVDGYNEVDVNVTPQLDSLTVTSNGTYTPGEGVDGYSEVNVNVPVDDELYSQIKVVDGVATDVIRGITPSLVNASVSGDNISFNTDNAWMGTYTNQLFNIPYCIEVDIVTFNADENTTKKGIITFGRGGTTLYGLFFDESNNTADLKFRTSSATDVIITADNIMPSDLNNSTVKVFINCDIDQNNNIIHSNNNVVVYILGNYYSFATQCDVINNTTLSPLDMGSNIGWSNYSWGATSLVISEYRYRILKSLL